MLCNRGTDSRRQCRWYDASHNACQVVTQRDKAGLCMINNVTGFIPIFISSLVHPQIKRGRAETVTRAATVLQNLAAQTAHLAAQIIDDPSNFGFIRIKPKNFIGMSGLQQDALGVDFRNKLSHCEKPIVRWYGVNLRHAPGVQDQDPDQPVLAPVKQHIFLPVDLHLRPPTESPTYPDQGIGLKTPLLHLTGGKLNGPLYQFLV